MRELGDFSVGVLHEGFRSVRMRPYLLPRITPDSVLLEVSVVGICGTDLHLYRSHEGVRAMPEGHEYSARVAAIGSNVTTLSVGQRVTVEPFLCAACGECEFCVMGLDFHCQRPDRRRYVGGFGQFLVAPAKGCFPLPDAVDDVLGALVEPLAVATHAVRMSAGMQGRSGMIIGAGSVGLCALAAARDAGADDVYVVARYPAQREVAMSLGAAGVFDSASPEFLDAIHKKFPRGVDFVIEAVGGTAPTLDFACDSLRPTGELIVLGAFSPGFYGLEALRPLLKEITIRHSNCYGRRDSLHDFEIAIDHLSRKGDLLRRLVSHQFPFQEAEEAFRVSSDKTLGAIKVQITMPVEKTLDPCLGYVDFSLEAPIPGVRSLSGFHAPEPWGRWSDGRCATVTFNDQLPEKLVLMLRGHAFGPNAGQNFVARIGGESRAFVLSAGSDDTVFMEFTNPGGACELTIFIPEPSSPESLGQGEDGRMLGIGLVEIVVFPGEKSFKP